MLKAREDRSRKLKREVWHAISSNCVAPDWGVTCHPGFAQDAPKAGGPTPSPPGAEVYFVDLKDGQTVPPNFIVHFGLKNMGVAPAGSDRPNTGHHHLLIDTDLPPLDQPIPSDFNHLHFWRRPNRGGGDVAAGAAHIAAALGDKDHIPHSPPVLSPRIRIIVASTADVAAASYERRPSPKGAREYFVGLHDDDYLSPNPVHSLWSHQHGRGAGRSREA